MYYFTIREKVHVVETDRPRTPMGPEPLLRCGKGAEGARRADRGAHAGSLPRFGPRGRVKPYSCLGCIELGSLKSYSASYTERESCLGFEPPLRCAWASFYSSRGHRQVST